MDAFKSARNYTRNTSKSGISQTLSVFFFFFFSSAYTNTNKIRFKPRTFVPAKIWLVPLMVANKDTINEE